MGKLLKWRFAIGTTSRVPHREAYHYLIADFDFEEPPWDDPFLCGILTNGRHIWEQTRHGWHLYTDIQMDFERLVLTLGMIRADEVWIRIGRNRGYYFLAHKQFLTFPWPVEYMYLHNAKKETRNTTKS